MSEQLRPEQPKLDSAPGAVAHGGKTRRRDALKYGLGVLLGAGGTVGGLYGAAKAGWLDSIVRDVLRGDGSRYQQATWWANIKTDADMTNWPSFPGDPNASQFDMSKWKVRFFQTSREAYEEQRRTLQNPQDAMSFKRREGVINVATMPNGEPMYTSPEGNIDELVIGMREGPGELRGMPGFWLEEENKFIPASAGAVALSPVVEQRDVWRDMPGAFWV